MDILFGCKKEICVCIEIRSLTITSGNSMSQNFAIRSQANGANWFHLAALLMFFFLGKKTQGMCRET
jgi:hypothetical protein